MRAVIASGAGGPDVLSVADLPDPEPGPGEVAISVVATAINRADLLQRQGHDPPPPGASGIIGLECSGTIDAVGPDVTDWAVGDKVCALLAGGGYATKVVKTREPFAAASWIAKVPIPPAPPCTRNASPGASRPIAKTFDQTVQNTSGSPAASANETPSGTPSTCPAGTTTCSA